MQQNITKEVSITALIRRLERCLAPAEGETLIDPLEVLRSLTKLRDSDLRQLEPVLSRCAAHHRQYVSADYENGFQTALDALRHRLEMRG